MRLFEVESGEFVSRETCFSQGIGDFQQDGIVSLHWIFFRYSYSTICPDNPNLASVSRETYGSRMIVETKLWLLPHESLISP